MEKFAALSFPDLSCCLWYLPKIPPQNRDSISVSHLPVVLLVHWQGYPLLYLSFGSFPHFEESVVQGLLVPWFELGELAFDPILLMW